VRIDIEEVTNMARIVLVFVHVTGGIGVFAALAMAIAGGAGFLAALPYVARTSRGSMVSA
jgi:hypothetical protein